MRLGKPALLIVIVSLFVLLVGMPVSAQDCPEGKFPVGDRCIDDIHRAEVDRFIDLLLAKEEEDLEVRSFALKARDEFFLDAVDGDFDYPPTVGTSFIYKRECIEGIDINYRPQDFELRRLTEDSYQIFRVDYDGEAWMRNIPHSLDYTAKTAIETLYRDLACTGDTMLPANGEYDLYDIHIGAFCPPKSGNFEAFRVRVPHKVLGSTVKTLAPGSIDSDDTHGVVHPIGDCYIIAPPEIVPDIVGLFGYVQIVRQSEHATNVYDANTGKVGYVMVPITPPTE